MKRKLVIATVASILSVAMVIGIIYNNGVIKSKADELSTNESVDVQDNEDAYKDFVQKFRKDGVEITITSLEDLYTEFNNYDIVDETVRESVLAKTSDEVIMQFLAEEEKEMFELGKEVEADNIFSELEQDNSNNIDGITELDTNYYKKDTDSYKKVTKIKTQYGNDFEIVAIDEKDEQITRANYEHIRTIKNEVIYKDYGDRKFSVTYKYLLGEMTTTLGYKLSYGRIDYRYISADTGCCLPGVSNFTVGEQIPLKQTATNIGDKVSAHAIYKGQLAGALYGGIGGINVKIVMNVVKGGDSNSTWKCGMSITQNAEVYKN